MESYVQNGALSLADSLSFKVQPAGSYVTDRRSMSFFPTGGNEYTPNGVRVIKISLNGDQWLDPSTVKLFYNITNTTQKPDPTDGSGNYTNTLQPLANGPWVFFRRMRIICGGQIIEDIDHYNRVHQMIDILNPTNRRINSEIEGFQARSYSNEDIVIKKNTSLFAIAQFSWNLNS